MGQCLSSELYVSKVVRLSIKSCPDPAGSPLQGFEIVCYSLEDPNLEELFLIVNRGNKSVRAVIGRENAGWIPSECILRNNIGLYRPYWSDGQGRAITRLHIPSQMQQEVFMEELVLMERLWGWMDAGTDWRIRPLSRSFSEEQDADADVKHVGWIAESKGIAKVSWRGCTFVLKDTWSDEEFNYLRRLSPHPNIVPSFGVLCRRLEEETPVQKAYFMEYISGGDLLSLIVEKKRLQDRRLPMPPFPAHDTLDILLQFAIAVKHMHQKGVVHCDLKSENVLISNTARYLVKVADFGSAREWGTRPFIAGPGTTWYAAPEYHQQLKDKSIVIDDPNKIDVYSFGVVAFELLTGDIYFKLCEKLKLSMDNFRARVIDDRAFRPPLRQVFLHIQRSRGRIIESLGSERQFVERYWHMQQEDLILFVERCWSRDPAERPSFCDICEVLDQVTLRFLSDRR